MRNGFKDFHPVSNLIFFLSVIVFGMLFRHPVTITACFFCALLWYIMLCGRDAVKSFFTFIVPMLVFVIIIGGLTAHYGETQLLTLPGGKPLTLEALIYGFVLGVAAVSVIMWFFCWNEVITADKFMHIFGKLLPAAALVISMALRFVPMYKNRLRAITEAQKGIGMDFKSGSFTQRIKNGVKTISILITWSLENAVETSDAMRARGYGLSSRKNYGKYRFGKRDSVFCISAAVLDIIMAVGYFQQALMCSYNPSIVINPASDGKSAVFIDALHLTLNPVAPLGAAAMAAFILMCALPLLIEIREALKWNRLKLKI